MVSNLWSTVELYCDNNHEELVKMSFRNKGNVLCYVCPKCSADCLEPGESSCHNYITTRDFEKFLEKLSAVLYEAAINDEQVNLTHERFKIKTIEYRVFEHADKIKVLVKNKSEVEG